MAKGNKKPNKSKTKKPKKLKPFERPSEGNPDSAAQTPDVYYNNGPGKHGRNTKGSLFRSKKCLKELLVTWWTCYKNSILVHPISLRNGPKLQILTI